MWAGSFGPGEALVLNSMQTLDYKPCNMGHKREERPTTIQKHLRVLAGKRLAPVNMYAIRHVDIIVECEENGHLNNWRRKWQDSQRGPGIVDHTGIDERRDYVCPWEVTEEAEDVSKNDIEVNSTRIWTKEVRLKKYHGSWRAGGQKATSLEQQMASCQRASLGNRTINCELIF